jgi:azobenzene reductase
MIKISLIIGSVRMGRQTHKTGQYVAKKLSERQGVTVEILDLLDYNFPVMEERMGLHPNPPARLEEFSKKLSDSDAIVLVSPEYNGSYSGSLKNVLDYFGKEYKKKVMAVVTDSAGDFAGISASYQLQLFILKMGAIASPVKLMVPQVQKAFDASGNPIDEKIVKGTEVFIEELLWLTEAINNQKLKSQK